MSREQNLEAAIRKIVLASQLTVCGKTLKPTEGIKTGASLMRAIEQASKLLQDGSANTCRND